MGLRLRLRRAYFRRNLHRFPRGSQSRVIFQALFRYGIINADNGGSGSNWFITGARLEALEGRRPEPPEAVPGTRLRGGRFAGPIRTPC